MLKFRIHQKAITEKTIDPDNLPQTKFFLSHPHFLKPFICLFLILITLVAFWQVRNNVHSKIGVESL